MRDVSALRFPAIYRLLLSLPLLLSLTAPVLAQTPDSTTATLPTAVRLQLRGKVGDFTTYSATVSSGTNIMLTGLGPDKQQTELIEEETNAATRILNISPKGNIDLKLAFLNGKRLTDKNGEQVTTTPDPTPFTEVWSPQNVLVGRRRSATPPPKKGKGKPAQYTVPWEHEQIAFPDKVLHIGDRWSGKINIISKEITDTDVPLDVELVGIEFYKGIPCAKVAYKMDKLITEIPSNLQAKLPATAGIVGGMKVEGTIIEYRRLDRGFALHTEGKIMVKMEYDITVVNPNSNARITLKAKSDFDLTVQEDATKFPAYDPALVPPAS